MPSMLDLPKWISPGAVSQASLSEINLSVFSPTRNHAGRGADVKIKDVMHMSNLG